MFHKRGILTLDAILSLLSAAALLCWHELSAPSWLYWVTCLLISLLPAFPKLLAVGDKQLQIMIGIGYALLIVGFLNSSVISQFPNRRALIVAAVSIVLFWVDLLLVARLLQAGSASRNDGKRGVTLLQAYSAFSLAALLALFLLYFEVAAYLQQGGEKFAYLRTNALALLFVAFLAALFCVATQVAGQTNDSYSALPRSISKAFWAFALLAGIVELLGRASLYLYALSIVTVGLVVCGVLAKRQGLTVQPS